jgi:hypothetical protein
MAKAPVFMRVGPLPTAIKLKAAEARKPETRKPVKPAARVTTTVAKARLKRTPEAVVRANPRLAVELAKIKPHVVELLKDRQGGETRGQIDVPVCPVPNPSDTILYEAPAKASEKLYLPRYRLRESRGRYEIGMSASGEAGWRIAVGLERFPAPELGAGVQGAEELPHEIAVFFRYGSGPSNSIEKRVDFDEVTQDAKGVTVSATLTLGERDSLLTALQAPAANPQLVVRRAITVAVKTEQTPEQAKAPPLMRMPVAKMPGIENLRETAVRRRVALAQPVEMRAAVQPLALRARADLRLIRAGGQRPPAAEPRYRTLDRALDDAADPDPFVLDPRLHGYLYDGVSIGGAAASGEAFRRIVLAHPKGAADARFHAFLQDRSEPWVFYYLPDRFKLARQDTAPFLPQMVVRIAAEDGDIDNASATVDFVVQPWTDEARLETAAEALKREIPAGTGREAEPELRPLQAKAALKLWLPGPAGAVLSPQEDVSIDLANGFVHSITLPLEGFRQLYAAAYSRDATSLFSGQVLVETGLANPETVPLEIRFADTQGDILAFTGHPAGDGVLAMTVQNAIESPVRISALPATVSRNGGTVSATVEGLALDPPVELEPGAELSFTVRATGGSGEVDVEFDLDGVEILPDPEQILPLISDTSVPAEYERQIDVMTMPELLGDAGAPDSILLINIEFKGSGSLKLSREQTEGAAQVRLPLMDLLLDRDTQGTYRFRQQIIRRNGSQSIDPDWREADFSLLVVPMN